MKKITSSFFPLCFMSITLPGIFPLTSGTPFPLRLSRRTIMVFSCHLGWHWFIDFASLAWVLSVGESVFCFFSRIFEWKSVEFLWNFNIPVAWSKQTTPNAEALYVYYSTEQQRMFQNGAFSTKPDIPYNQYFLVGHRDQAKASSDVIEDFLSFPPTAICTAAQKRNIKKQR